MSWCSSVHKDRTQHRISGEKVILHLVPHIQKRRSRKTSYVNKNSVTKAFKHSYYGSAMQFGLYLERLQNPTCDGSAPSIPALKAVRLRKHSCRVGDKQSNQTLLI